MPFNIVIIYTLTLTGTITLLISNPGFSQDTVIKAIVKEVRNGTATIEGKDGERPAEPQSSMYAGETIHPITGTTVVIRCDQKTQPRDVITRSSLRKICPHLFPQSREIRSSHNLLIKYLS